MKRRDRARRRRRGEELDAPLPSGSSRKKRGRGSPVRLLLLVALLAVLLYGVYQLFASREEAAPVTVVVEQGDTLSSVAGKLEEAGVIGSSTLFELEARIEGGDKEIKPGEYRFAPGEDSDEILETLSSGDSISTFELTLPEGLTLAQTAQRVEEQVGIPAEEFEAAANSTGYEYDFLDDPAVQTTEGFLFPKTYEFDRDAGAGQIVDRLLQQYLVETEDLDFAAARERLNLTQYELVTVASLIEREAANPEERPLVASVIYNRVRAGMPLQVDATIQYVLGKPKEELKLSDLEVSSPYNTYKYPGLPPGPIANPSRESLRAALEPAGTGYLYYVLEAGGEEHFFTDDYDEFLEAKAEAEEER